MVIEREQSRQALKSLGVGIDEGDISRTVMCELFDKVARLAPEKRQLVLAEAATLMCIYSLKSMSPLYSGFEHHVWQRFMEMDDLVARVDSFTRPGEMVVYAASLYYDFHRSMFTKSTKTRHEFYYDMLTEAKIAPEINSINFGTNAITFQRRAEESMHMEHLLVFYSVELFLKAHIALHPRDSPISDEQIEAFYKHFEAAIPLVDKFERYAKDDSLFKFSACRRMLPLIN